MNKIFENASIQAKRKSHDYLTHSAFLVKKLDKRANKLNLAAINMKTDKVSKTSLTSRKVSLERPKKLLSTTPDLNGRNSTIIGATAS